MTVRSVLAAAAAVVFAVPVVATWHAGVPPSLRAVSLAVLLAGAIRPVWGVLLLCGLLPLATPIAVLADAPFGGAGTVELLVAPLLMAVAVREVFLRHASLTRLRWPAVALAAVVVASTLVQLAGQSPPQAFGDSRVPALWRFATGPYLVEAQHFPPLHDTMVWISGLALTVVIERVLRTSPDARPVVTRMVLVGAAAAAVFAANRLIEVSLRQVDPLSAAANFLISLRFNPHFGDLNAGGSFYAMMLVPAVWLAWSRHRSMWLAAPLLALGLWTTGSRTALAATVVGAGLVWSWTHQMSRRLLALIVVLTLVGGYLATLDPGRIETATPGTAVRIRAELVPVALKLAAIQPVFGLGLGQFRPASVPLIPESVVRAYPPSAAGANAHNNYLQILVELGLAGLAAWLWMLTTVGLAFVRARQASRADPALIGFAGGLGAFLVTCLAGHPLLTPQVLLPFSLVLGLTAGLIPDGPTAETQRRQARAAAAAAGVVMLSLVWRLP